MPVMSYGVLAGITMPMLHLCRARFLGSNNFVKGTGGDLLWADSEVVDGLGLMER
jgi:hypothetical protein